MQISATLKKIFPIVTGQGTNGIWKKQELLSEIGGQYPKMLFGAVWGDKVDATLLKEGNQLVVYFDVESREYNGRWYTDVKMWMLEPDTGSAPPPQDLPPVSDAASEDLGYDPMDPLPF